MTAETEKPRLPGTSWRTVLTVIVAIWLIGMWFIPDPSTFVDNYIDPEIRLGKTADPKATDVFEVRGKTLWFPVRYGARSKNYDHVVVQAYGPDLVSLAESGSTSLNVIEIRFSSHMADRSIKEATADALGALENGTSERPPQWNADLQLFEFNEENRHYYFSEKYTAPSSDPYVMVCERSGAYSIASANSACRVGYLIHGVIFLEYKFTISSGQEPSGWRELDLAVRRFALSALWRDGEMLSLDPTIGYDEAGRVLKTVGSHTLHFPTSLSSYATPGVAKIIQFRICVPTESTDGECPASVRTYLIASEGQEMPNDGDEMFARVMTGNSYGPVLIEGTNVEEFAYREGSASRDYRMLELDPSGRYPIVRCYSWCRSRFIAVPGLDVMYDFDRNLIDGWPEIDAAVRRQVAELIEPRPP